MKNRGLNGAVGTGLWKARPGTRGAARVGATIAAAAAVAVTAATTLAVTGAASPAAAQTATDPGPPPFVEVSANARVTVPSDRARVRFAVETRAGTAAAATRENADRMDAVIRALRELGIEGTKIETSGYDLSPVYNRPQRGEEPVITGYRAVNHVVLTVDDVGAVGRALDAGVNAGANRVAGISFEARNTDAARLEAVGLAVRKAREEASAMADALGVPLGPPMEVRGGAQEPDPRPMPYARMEAAAMDMAAVETPVEPGEQTVHAHVTVRYRLLVGG